MGIQVSQMGMPIIKTVAIADGASLSGALDTEGMTIVRITPATGTEGTVLTFQCSDDGTTFADVLDWYGSEVSAAFTAAKSISCVNHLDFVAARYWKIRAGTAAAATAQTGATTLSVALRRL